MTDQTTTPRRRAAKPRPPEFTPGEETGPAGVTGSDETPQAGAAASGCSSRSVQPAGGLVVGGGHQLPPGAATVSGALVDSPRTAPDSAGQPVPPGESPPPGTAAAAVIAAQAPVQTDGGPTPVAAGTFAIYEDGGGGYVLVVLDPNGVESRKHIPGAIVRMATGGGLVSKLGLGRLLGGMD